MARQARSEGKKSTGVCSIPKCRTVVYGDLPFCGEHFTMAGHDVRKRIFDLYVPGKTKQPHPAFYDAIEACRAEIIETLERVAEAAAAKRERT